MIKLLHVELTYIICRRSVEEIIKLLPGPQLDIKRVSFFISIKYSLFTPREGYITLSHAKHCSSFEQGGYSNSSTSETMHGGGQSNADRYKILILHICLW